MPPIATPSRPTPSASTPRATGFATTRWTLVAASSDAERSAPAEAALDELCRAYWYPIYAFVRRRGAARDDAEDLTQAFFARILEKRTIAAARRERGRFRTFLLAALKHFLSDEWDKTRALKRGGGQPVLSLDAETAEERYRLEPVDHLTPERVFERKWALHLLDEVMRRLAEEYAATGQAALFGHLRFCLAGERSQAPYAELARQLGLTEGAVKVAVHRLRKRYRERLREEVAQTVARPEDIEDELRHLFDAIAG